MSSMAKTAREAMKAKAQRLGSSRPLEKVDSSTFTPPELLDADVKTGARPISRRAFKKGGKVMGSACEARADRKPRKSGGKAEATEYANAKVNRNVKAANEERDGKKHVGAFAKGGKTKRKGRDEGGKVDEIGEYLKKDTTPAVAPKGPLTKEQAGVKTGGGSAAERAANAAAFDKQQRDYQRSLPQNRKAGGRAKKNDGGPMSGAQEMMSRAQKTAGVPSDVISSVPASSRFSQSMGMKKGGKAHDDEAADKALIKKMVKPSARTGRKSGGGVFSGEGYPHKVPGVVAGGRDARKSGGRTKGKTNINIVIAAGKQPGADAGMMPPAGMPKAPGGMPIPMPAKDGAQPPMPMPMPMPMPAPAPAAGPAPMARKSGGRISKIAKSYKDMEAGAGSGEGRLQKADIAKRNMRKAGGKVYRSYKDMDAGAGSGMGRLEKTEIARKH